MSQTQNPSADGAARGAPKDVPDQNDFGVPQRRRPAQAATAKPRRRIRSETWSSISAAIVRQHQALPSNSPRLKPTLPRLRWLEPAVGTAAVGGG
jgi:hypothetical protein